MEGWPILRFLADMYTGGDGFEHFVGGFGFGGGTVEGFVTRSNLSFTVDEISISPWSIEYSKGLFFVIFERVYCSMTPEFWELDFGLPIFTLLYGFVDFPEGVPIFTLLYGFDEFPEGDPIFTLLLGEEILLEPFEEGLMRTSTPLE